MERIDTALDASDDKARECSIVVLEQYFGNLVDYRKLTKTELFMSIVHLPEGGEESTMRKRLDLVMPNLKQLYVM